jgi:hypothetical protein
MSMSEFEGQQEIDADGDCTLAENALFPADFSADDVEFARELGSLFAPEQEEMPPLFVQTLLDAEDPRFQSLEGGLEFKTRARVFRRLKLKQRLFRTHSSSLRSALTSFSVPSSFSRSFLLLACSLFLVVVISVAVTGPSFASGLNYLWTGAHSGVLQVKTFPIVFAPAKKSAAPSRSTQKTAIARSTNGYADTVAPPADRQLTVASAQSMLNFKLSLPLYMPDSYQQTNYYLYDGDPSWANGPIMVQDYTHALPGVAPTHITICEFKPQGQVLQVAQDDAAHQLRILHGNSQSSIVYVEGQWTSINHSSYVWDYNNRSEVVFELNGAEIWIVGDKRDGIGQAELLKIANSLTTYDPALSRVTNQVDRVMQTDENTPGMFAGDVIYLNNPDNVGGPSFKLIGMPSSQVGHHVKPHLP